MSPSRWPRSQFRELCSPISCGWSRNCGHHRRPFRREALDCFASDQKPREMVRLNATKIDIFGARRADVTGLGAREPSVEGSALPKSVESGNLSLNKVGIGR